MQVSCVLQIRLLRLQLAEFRLLEELVEPDGTTEYLEDNWRPTEPLDGRQIQRSFTSLIGFSSSAIGFSSNIMSHVTLIGAIGVVLQFFV